MRISDWSSDVCSSDLAPAPIHPNAFIRIGADDSVTIVSKHIEFGQGPYTGLATLAADELDADWSQLPVVSAPPNPAVYATPELGTLLRSEERRVGKECVSTCRSRWSPNHKKKK